MHPSGSSHEAQMWSWKPFPGCDAPKTPFANFYICQSTSAGNYTSLAAGYIAACAVMDDLGGERADWWCGEAMQGSVELLRREGVTPRYTVD
jgi:hypothetical protein